MASPTYLGHSITSNLGFPGSSAGEESVSNAGDPQFNSWVGKIPWRRDSLPSLVCLGFHGVSDDKKSACNMRDLGSIPGLGRERKVQPLEKGKATHSSILAWRIPWTV